MAWQLIYTSAPRVLSAGQSGYGTVARSLDLREALAQRLEQLSYYGYPSTASKRARATPPVICAYRVIDLRGAKYHLLTRIQDAGLDFTSRTNHLAHHLVFAPEELAALPSPAILFQQWDGWRSEWREEPRFLDDDWGNFSRLPRAVPLPAETWQRLTGDAGRAAALVERPCASGCYLVCDLGSESPLLGLFAESLQLLDPESKSPAKRWHFPFTTLLQDQDNPADFRWRGCEYGSPPWLAAQRGTSAMISTPTELPVPGGDLAGLARRGPQRPIATPEAGQARPGVSGGATGSPLRMLKPRVPQPTPIRGWNPNEYRAGDARRAKAARGPVVNLLSPRLLGPAVGLAALLLVLLGGFVWPGWFVQPQRPALESAPALPSQASTTPPPPEIRQATALLADIEPLPAETAPNPLSPPEPPRPSLQTLAELDRELDGIRSYLVQVAGEDSISLPRIAELEALLASAFKDDPAVRGTVEAFAHTNHLNLSVTPSAPPLAVEFQEVPDKSLLLRNQAGPVLQFDPADWYRDAARPVRLRAQTTGLRSLTVLVRPTKGNGSFTPFRLVLAVDGMPEPIQLSKTFLRANRTTLAASLDTNLHARLAALTLSPGLRLQLRPFVGAPPRDLYEELGTNHWVEGGSLHLDRLRARLKKEVEWPQKALKMVADDLAALEQETAERSAADIPLGQVLGLSKPDDPLVSFLDYAREKKLPLDRRAFGLYLSDLLRASKLDNRHWTRLNRKLSPELLTQLPEWLQQAGHDVSRLKPDYLLNRWQELGKAEESRQKQRERQARLKSDFADAQARLEKVPPGLSALPYVSLFVVAADGTRRLELIRFTDTPPETAP